MLEIFCLRDRTPTDEEIVSFFHMVFAPDQTAWNFEEEQEIWTMPDAEFVEFFKEKPSKRDNNYGYWAKIDGRIVGMAGLNQYEDEPRSHCAELGFGVSEKYQRQGIGYRLVCTAIKRARVEGLKRIESCCFAINTRAIGLLTKAGFADEGLRKGAIQKNGKLYDLRMFGLMLV